MSIFTLISIIFTASILLGYINYRFIKMQPTIAITMATLCFSVLLILFGHFGIHLFQDALSKLMAKIDFHDILMNGMLSFLLFAGALTIDLSDLKDRKWEVGILASLGTIVSTFIIGTLSYYLLAALHVSISYGYCLLFGALISPTDPIAVLAIFKQVGASKKIYTTVAGESLFNDGIAVVLFLTIYNVLFSTHTPTASEVSLLFLQQAFGGIIYGIALGYLGYFLIKPIDDFKLEIFITLAITTGGYALAQALDISGPLAMVVAGLFIGNHNRDFFMTAKTRHNLENFWELIDEALNSILFLLVGLEILAIHIGKINLILGVAAIIIVLFARCISVGVPYSLFKFKRKYKPYTVRIMIWGGLRGGLALAMALAIPNGLERNIILPMTYAVVVFSIIVQGMTVKSLVLRSNK